MQLREKSAVDNAPAAQGRLLDLAINAMKMAVHANMEERDKAMSGAPEKYTDMLRALARSPEGFPEKLAMMRDNSHAHERFLRSRASHLMGLSPHILASPKTPAAKNSEANAARSAQSALSVSLLNQTRKAGLSGSQSAFDLNANKSEKGSPSPSRQKHLSAEIEQE